MTVTAPEGDNGADEETWEAATLKSLRIAKGLTQEKLADLAKINRSRYNALERSRQAMTRYYAERIAPHLGVKPEGLLPPQDLPNLPDSPLVLLRELAETVETMGLTIAEHEERIAALEQDGEKPGRSHGAER